MSGRKNNERDWWLFELFRMVDARVENIDGLEDHVGRLADAYANPRDFLSALEQNKPHPIFTGVRQGSANSEFIQRCKKFIDDAPYSVFCRNYEDAVAEEECERLKRLQDAQRVIANEGRVE